MEKRLNTIEVRKGEQHYCVVKAPNGEIVLVSESYASSTKAKRARDNAAKKMNLKIKDGVWDASGQRIS